MQESYFSPYTRVHGFAKPLEDNDLHMKTKTHKLQCEWILKLRNGPKKLLTQKNTNLWYLNH